MQRPMAKRVSVWLWEEDYPHSLSEEELRNPATVLQQVFSQYSLADCQYLLWEWQHCHYRPFSFSFGEGLVTLFRFRKVLNKLLDVAWLIARDMDDGHLLRVCTEEKGRHIWERDYFLALKRENLPTLGDTLKRMLSDGGGLQWWKNILYHWWGMGISHEQLDDGTRTNPMDEIPQFIQLALMIEIQYVIAMALEYSPGENRFAALAYLSIEEGRKPVKTLMKIFSKWEYEELKEKLRQLYYLLNFCMDDNGNLSEPNGIIHTLHKIIALASLLAKNGDDYFLQPENFSFPYEGLGCFWQHDHHLPFHHLSDEEYERPLLAIRSFDLPGLHRGLHRFTVYIASDRTLKLDEEVIAFVGLFQQLERLLEALYLLVIQRIRIEY
ncbi:hypothetical protein SAMN05421747_10768 [Parapedobacter composti]|uniref:Uncharacterized protein n=2 Tax=Parapedobacter composti TaxID=623281 RepID=A0A1I1HQI4_9SPHI|nr:hypothetical protein SAMN05421747_10768 [Parapedobacter composti]